jgi:hypothetical protein
MKYLVGALMIGLLVGTNVHASQYQPSAPAQSEIHPAARYGGNRATSSGVHASSTSLQSNHSQKTKPQTFTEGLALPHIDPKQEKLSRALTRATVQANQAKTEQLGTAQIDHAVVKAQTNQANAISALESHVNRQFLVDDSDAKESAQATAVNGAQRAANGAGRPSTLSFKPKVFPTKPDGHAIKPASGRSRTFQPASAVP